MKAKNLAANLKQLLSTEGVRNLSLEEDVDYVLRQEDGFQELEASFVVEALEFKELPNVQGTVWIEVKIFAPSDHVEESELNSIVLEISGPTDVLQSKEVRIEFERLFHGHP